MNEQKQKEQRTGRQVGRSNANRPELKINLRLIINELNLPAQIRQPILHLTFVSIFVITTFICVYVCVSMFSERIKYVFFQHSLGNFLFLKKIFLKKNVCDIPSLQSWFCKSFSNLGLHQNPWEILNQYGWASAQLFTNCSVSLRTTEACELSPQRMSPSTPCK